MLDHLVATIGWMLAPTLKSGQLKGNSATKACSLLRNSINVCRAGAGHEKAPGILEADLVAHCTPTLVGEFVRTLTVTDVFTGWRQEHGNQEPGPINQMTTPLN